MIINTFLNKPYKLVVMLEYARRIYEQGLENGQAGKEFGAGALWALSCILNDSNEIEENIEIPASFEELLEKTKTYNFKRRFCDGCEVKRSADLAWQMLRITRPRNGFSDTQIHPG